MVRKKRRKPSNVEEVELQPVNVAGVELQREQSDSNVEDLESIYLGTRQSNDNTKEESSYLWQAYCAQRFADMPSDDGYALPYEVLPCFTEETQFGVGTPFLGRRRTSMAERSLPALPPQSRNCLYRRPPTPKPRVRIDTRSNDDLLLPTTDYDSDSSESSGVTVLYNSTIYHRQLNVHQVFLC